MNSHPEPHFQVLGSETWTTLQLARATAEIAACENGEYGVGPLWLYMLGWADWMMEAELIRQEQSAQGGRKRLLTSR